MAPSLDAEPRKRGLSRNSNPDLIALCGAGSEIDARYGEMLRPLLPRRLDQLLPIARAA